MHHLSYSNSEQQALADKKGYLKVGKFADDSWAHVQDTCNAMSVAITKELHDELVFFGVPKFVHELKRMPKHVQDFWLEAMKAELHNLETVHNAITIYDEDTDERPASEEVWNSTWAFKAGGPDARYPAPYEGAKWARGKARGVIVRGIDRADANIWKIHSSTGQMASFRLFLAFVATLGLDMELWDLQGAYLNFKRPKSVWMKMFPYLRDLPEYKGKIIKCTGNIYGSLEGARICERGIAVELVNNEGFRRFAEADHSCYIRFDRVDDPKSTNPDKKTGVLIAIWNFADNFMPVATPGFDLLTKLRTSMCTRLPVDLEASITTSPEQPVIEIDTMGLTIVRSHERQTIELSAKSYLRRFSQRFFDTTPDKINKPSTPQVPGQVLSRDACPTTDAERDAIKAKYPVNAYEMLGCLMFAVNGCRPDLAQTTSQIMSLASNMSMDAHAALRHLGKYAAATHDRAIHYYAYDRPWFNLRLLASADAAFPGVTPNMKSDRLSSMVTPRARIGGVVGLAHGAVIWYTGDLKRPFDSTTAVEIASLNRMVRELQWALKFMSYWIADSDPINIPHIVHRAPVLIQQDNRSAIAFTHNPVSMAAMKGNLIRMSGVRDALELGLIYPCSTPTMDMVSDLNTKACSCKDRERLVPQLMGHTVWTAFSKEDKDIKPGVCKQCISADLSFTFSDSEMRWQGLCNSCGTVTLA